MTVNRKVALNDMVYVHAYEGLMNSRLRFRLTLKWTLNNIAMRKSQRTRQPR
jgi:hypothetical protein